MLLLSVFVKFYIIVVAAEIWKPRLKYNVVQTGATLNIQSLDMVMVNIVLKSRSERLIEKCLVESR